MKLALSALLLFATATLAQEQEKPREAEVVEVEGSVQADPGTGLAPLVEKQKVGPTTRVLVDADSFTILSFGKDCDIRLEPGDWTVPNPSAATLTEIEGGVQIFVQEEFTAVTPNQPVKVKDRILVQSESSAILRYETGCDVKLDPGIHEVGDGCTCLAGAYVADRPMWPWVTGALVVGAAVALDQDNDPITDQPCCN